MQMLARKLLLKPTSFKSGIGRCTYSTSSVLDIGQPTSATHPQLLREGEITPGISCYEFLSRRRRLLELLPENSVAIVASAPVKMMTDVVPYTFRQEADYLYITGCIQPGGVAVLGHDFGLCMFMPEATRHDVTWQGQVAGVDAALETFKAEIAYPMSKLHHVLPDMIKKCANVFHNTQTAIPRYTELEDFQKATKLGRVKDISIFTHELRWVKSPAELKIMRESASIVCQALLQTMLHSKVYPNEGVLAAKIEYESKMRGAQRMAFNPVVGGGSNGSVIHYSRNDQKVKDGDFVLMDVGCEFHGYVSDLTRTWPPCGSFSPIQVELYDLVLQTNKECVKLCKPGASIREIHDYSVEMLQKGLREIGILKDSRSNSYHQLNPTAIGHYLGMDVHDCSTISYDRPLKPGVAAEESETDSEESDVSGSDGDDTSWISWFCNLRGNEFFCEVDDEYIQDDFNLCGLSGQVPYYDYALDLILDVESSHGDMFTEEQNELVESAAEMLYGLIHVRYILTTKGMSAMLEKYKNYDFGRCPRVYCCGQPCLPVGQSDIPRSSTVKIYCPKCEDIYYPRSKYQGNIDGAYFGSTFPHLFLMTYGHLRPQKAAQSYVPRVFGFKIHKP